MTEIQKGYEFFNHTADIGLRARGATLEGLFISMARGLFELVAEESRLEPRLRREIRLEASDTESLLLAWLTELLFIFTTERFIPAAYLFDTLTPTMLRGRLQGDIFDPARHTQGREVKAITRHLLAVRQEQNGWYAQVIVDI